jgi:hypothetical protein
MGVDSKTCNTCGVFKPIEAFSLSGGRVEGSCRECRNRGRARSTGVAAYLRNLHTKCKSHCKRTGRAEFLLEPGQLLEIWEAQKGRCALSASGPYAKDNVRLVCDRVNTMRHTLSEHEFWWWVKNIHDHTEDHDDAAG